MRVLTRGRVALAPVLAAGTVALVLTTLGGTTAHAAPPSGATTTGVVAPAGQRPAATTGHRSAVAVLGPAVAYVRAPDGTVRRVR
jgi:hypothetical protein